MAIAKAHITWNPNGLGANFAAYWVQRQHDVGWFDIAKITLEATVAFDDYEARRTGLGVAPVPEFYRVLVEDISGIRSIPAAAQSVSLAAAGTTIVSNEDPTINAEIDVVYPLAVQLPSNESLSQLVGRYGQHLARSPDVQGESIPLTVNLTDGVGPELWRQPVKNMRKPGLSYVCVLSPFGDRWFAGLRPSAANMKFFSYADLTAGLVEVTDTPAVVTV